MTHAAAPTTTTEPTNALNIRSWADARVFIQTAAPIVTTLLATYGVVDHEQAALWAALVVAVAGSALATINTAAGFRRWFYPVLGAANAVAVTYGALNPETIDMWLPVVTLIIGGTGSGVANANTNTTPSTEHVSRRAQQRKRMRELQDAD